MAKKEKLKLKLGVKLLIGLVLFLTLISAVHYFFPFFFPGIIKNLTGIDLGGKDPNITLSGDNSQGQTSSQATDELDYVTFLSRVGGYSGEKTYLVWYQNAMELRPTGGFIGSYALVTVDKGKIKSKKVYNTAVVDKTLTSNPLAPESPEILQQFVQTETWGTKDANWFFDYDKSVENFLRINKIAGFNQKIDGVIAVTTNILPFLIEKTGPIKLDQVAGEFTTENVLTKLEYEVEVGYTKRGVNKDDRKKIVQDLGFAIIDKIFNQNRLSQIKTANEVKDLLDKKEIQMFFYDQELTEFANKNRWSGRVLDYKGADYLALIDTNVGALKTDRCMKRNIDYLVDFTLEKPVVTLDLQYLNTCQEVNFMTNDYQSYQRLYVHKNSLFKESTGFSASFREGLIDKTNGAVLLDESGKKVFANLVRVKLNNQANFSYTYELNNSEITREEFKLFYQKQAGMNPPFLRVSIKDQNGEKIIFSDEVEKDIVIEEKGFLGL
jgi:hypothetical protein